MGEGALARGQLLAGKEEEAHVDRERGALGLDPRGQLEHHREATLHVGGAEADDLARLDPAGEVVLGGHGVEVAGEHDERRSRPARSRV